MKKVLLLLVISTVLVGCGTRSGNGSYYMLSENHGSWSFPSKRVATGKNTFVFNPRVMAWAAYDEQGYRVRTGPASGGVDACPEDGDDCRTVVGSFRVQRKGGSDCTSSKYPLGEGGAPMAYCMHFSGGYAIHGASGVPSVNASHGCIRVMKKHARWLNQEFLDVGSPVIVKSY